MITWLTPSATCGCFLFVIRREGSLQIHHQDMKTYKPEEEWFGAVGFNNHRFISGHKCSFKKNIWCQNKKIGVYMFLKNTLVFRFVRFSRTLPHPEVEETEDRIGCRVPVFVWCDWTVFTRHVPACWWRQNQDFIEKPGSFPHSNQVVVVSEQNLSMSTSLWQHTNKNETSGNVMLLQICGLQKLGDIYSCDRVGPPTGQKPPEFIMF